jgi:molybdopterin molybdotransferase
VSRPRLMPVDEALAQVIASVAGPVDEEAVPLAEVFGRTLARDVAARRIQPPFASSAMDGYALRAADAAAAQARLTVVGEAAAGRPFAGRLKVGETVRIFTGAPLPEGADSVAMQELAQRDGDVVTFAAPVAPGDHVRRRGCDFVEGEILLPAGRRLTARDVALAAAADHPTLAVRRRPRVAILSSGDELATPGETRGPAQIVASNAFAVAGVILAAGGEPLDLGVAPDDPAALADRLAEARRAKADVLTTIGGASVGDHDLIRQALADAGMALDFWRIAMRPGKPLIHGRLDAMSVLGLPGNPTSATVCAILFLRPLLRALLGDPQAGGDPTEPARLAAPAAANQERATYLRATLAMGPGGETLATPIADQDSSLAKALARADALLVRPIGAPPAAAGDPCRIIRLAPLGA